MKDREIVYRLAKRWVGLREVPGRNATNPVILGMLKLDDDWPEDDAVPWCSAFVNRICWEWSQPRSKSLRARSWLRVGTVITLSKALPGDIIILKRGGEDQPGPEVIDAPGHVGFFAGHELDPETREELVWVLGGNQDNSVNISPYPVERILGVRRL